MRRNLSWWAPWLGPVIAIGVASASAAVRGDVGSANVGIGLAVVVATAALIGRLAGVTTAAAAALSFNYFHTEPYHTFRINSAGDAAIVALLALLGFVVGDLSTWRRQHHAQARVTEFGDEAVAHAITLLEQARPVVEVWHATVDASVGGLSEADCRYVPGGAAPGLSLVGRPAREPRRSETRVVIPYAGAAVPVLCEGVVVGHLVVVPRRDVTPLAVDRRALAALADHIALVVSPLRERDGRWTASTARD